MRYYYATLHQCDACGATTLVPQPCDLRTMSGDPRPTGWGLPKSVGVAMTIYMEPAADRVRIEDICASCMQLPYETIIDMAARRQNG